MIDADGNAKLDCNRVRWEGDTPKTADQGLDSDLAALYSGDFIDATSNPMLDFMMQAQIAGKSNLDPLARAYAQTTKVMVVPHVSAVIAALNKVCDAKSGDEADWKWRCDDVKSDLVHDLQLSADESPHDWAALVKMVDDGKSKKDDAAIVSARALEHIESDARKLVAPPIEAALEKSAQITLQSQHGGVVLQVQPGTRTILPGVQRKHQQDEDQDEDQDQDQARALKVDLLAQWHTYKALAAPESVRDFSVSGVVTGAGRDASGAPLFQVDASRTVDNPRAPVLYSVWAVLALVLALLHATLFVLRYVAARRVFREREAFYRQRTAPVIF
jgi:hypothetical protein